VEQSTAPEIVVTSTNTLDTQLAASGTGYKVYGLGSNSLLFYNVPNGSGNSDYTINIPLSWVVGSGTGDHVYIYMQYTGADGGFDELAIDKGITSNYGNTPLTPEAHTVWGGISIAAILAGAFIRRRLQKRNEPAEPA
jgi:hypothetical protein